MYISNPYVDYDDYLPGCVWQLQSGQFSLHSTITVSECRNEILKLLQDNEKKVHICVWSYQRYWHDKNSGPCLCCELNFVDCSECYQCFKNNLMNEYNDRFKECLLSDRKTSTNENLSCYRCLNVKRPTYNCQSYNNFLMKHHKTDRYFHQSRKNNKV